VAISGTVNLIRLLVSDLEPAMYAALRLYETLGNPIV
jgi:hypothetical protein